MNNQKEIVRLIAEVINTKEELEQKIIECTHHNYRQKIDLLVGNNLGFIEWCIQEVEDIIPKTIEKYPHLKKKENYRDYGYEKYQTIYLHSFVENIIEDFDYLNIEISEEDEEEIAKEVFDYIVKTNIIGFKYDW